MEGNRDAIRHSLSFCLQYEEEDARPLTREIKFGPPPPRVPDAGGGGPPLSPSPSFAFCLGAKKSDIVGAHDTRRAISCRTTQTVPRFYHRRENVLPESSPSSFLPWDTEAKPLPHKKLRQRKHQKKLCSS